MANDDCAGTLASNSGSTNSYGCRSLSEASKGNPSPGNCSTCIKQKQEPLSVNTFASRPLRTERSRAYGALDAVPFTPSQGVRTPSPNNRAALKSRMFSPFATTALNRLRTEASGERIPAAHGTDSSSTGREGPGSPASYHAYSPFMMYPAGAPLPGYLGDMPSGSPLLPGSPMSPGVVFHPSPFIAGAPGSPSAYYTPANPFSNAAPAAPGFAMAAMPLAGDPAVPNGLQQQYYYTSGGAAVSSMGGPPGLAPYSRMGSMPAVVPPGLQNGFGAMAYGQPYVQGYPQGVVPPMAGYSMDVRNQQGIMLDPSHQLPNQMRRGMSTPPVPMGAMPGIPHQYAAGSGMNPMMDSLSHLQRSRLHVSASADLSNFDPIKLAQVQAQNRPRFKPRKNSEPKIGPDGQPRLNARQRRTLRRAKERALKGLLEVSQVLLQKADVDVQMPNLSNLAALEELVHEAGTHSGDESPTEGSRLGQPASSNQREGGSGHGSGTNSMPRSSQQQLSAAVAMAEEAATKIATAAVAAVAAAAAGRDTSSAAAAVQAAVNAANSAAANANAVANANMSGNFGDAANNSTQADSLIQDLQSMNLTGGDQQSSPPESGAASPADLASAMAAAGSLSPRPLAPVSSAAPSPLSQGSNRGLGSAADGLDGLDIASLIAQLSTKKDEGMVDDKLIRDLQIIQSLIGALKAPLPPSGASGRAPMGKALPKRSYTYSPSSFAFH